MEDREKLLQQLTEVYARKMAERSGKPRRAKPIDAHPETAQHLFGLDIELPDFSGDFCSDAQNSIDFLQKEITSFGMFIPDKYETPAMVFLETIEEVFMPLVCEVPLRPAERRRAARNFNNPPV